jgi:hypothetical protein
MEAFTFEHDQIETTIGLIDVYFDVQFQIIEDETGKECEWEPDHTLHASLWNEDGENTDLLIKHGEPLYYEVLKKCNDAIIDECYENASGW